MFVLVLLHCVDENRELEIAFPGTNISTIDLLCGLGHVNLCVAIKDEDNTSVL